MLSIHALLLLVFCASLNGQSTESDEYAAIADLDYCGQSCPSSCEEAEDEDAVCRCDSECEWYGDCCSPPSGRLNCTGGEERAQPLAGLQCHSIHLDSRTQPRRMEAFWMVSACPEDWPANQDDEILREVDEKCSNGSDTLPPVTDLDDGVVYKNEYCAVCHQVTNIQPWRYRFGCSKCLGEGIHIEDLILTHETIERECIACGFHVPQTGPPPRPCLHDSLVVGECLTREVLEERTGLRWEEEVYSDIVAQCQTGPVRPVAAKPCRYPPIYRNQYCAICNAEKSADIECANPYGNREYTNYCLLDADVKFLSCDHNTFELGASGSYAMPGNSGIRKEMPNDPDLQTSGSAETMTDDDPGTYHLGSGEVISISITAPSYTICLLSPLNYASFSLFLDVRGDSGMITSDIVSSSITTSCSKGQVFDPINHVCRQTICPEGFATHQESCTVVQNISLTEANNSSNDSLVMCDNRFIVLRESEFELLDNDTLLFRNEAFEIVGYNDSSPIICSNFTQNGTISQNMTVFNYSYPPIFSVLTYVCCSLSVVGCILVLLTYSLFKELRTLPGQILMNLVSTILATCLFLLVGIPIAVVAEKDELCEATAILLHWLILSQFSWMSIMSFELLRTFYRASRLHPVEEKSKKDKLLLLYLLIGWGIPILITFIVLLVNFTTDMIQYGKYGFCWIGHVPSFYIVFVAPVALSIVFNGTTLITTFILLFKASRSQAKLKNRKRTSYLRISLCVFSITGLTWIFGFLAILIGDDWAWYAFIILTSTQGLVICTAFIFTQKVAGLYRVLFFSSLHAISCSESSSVKHKQEISLVTYVGKTGNASRVPIKYGPAEDGAKPTEVAIRNTMGTESGDHVAVKMDM